MNQKIHFTNSNNPTIDLSAVLYLPPAFDANRQYPAIVVSHPGGGVKSKLPEPTQKTGGTGLCDRGLRCLLSGESGGQPRQLENPYIRTEDVSAVIDHLTTLPYIDNARIGAMKFAPGRAIP